MKKAYFFTTLILGMLSFPAVAVAGDISIDSGKGLSLTPYKNLSNEGQISSDNIIIKNTEGYAQTVYFVLGNKGGSTIGLKDESVLDNDFGDEKAAYVHLINPETGEKYLVYEKDSKIELGVLEPEESLSLKVCGELNVSAPWEASDNLNLDLVFSAEGDEPTADEDSSAAVTAPEEDNKPSDDAAVTEPSEDDNTSSDATVTEPSEDDSTSDDTTAAEPSEDDNTSDDTAVTEPSEDDSTSDDTTVTEPSEDDNTSDDADDSSDVSSDSSDSSSDSSDAGSDSSDSGSDSSDSSSDSSDSGSDSSDSSSDSSDSGSDSSDSSSDSSEN